MQPKYSKCTFTLMRHLLFFAAFLPSCSLHRTTKHSDLLGRSFLFTEGRRMERKWPNEEQIMKYDSALQAVLKVGYDMLTHDANGDIVVECLTMSRMPSF